MKDDVPLTIGGVEWRFPYETTDDIRRLDAFLSSEMFVMDRVDVGLAQLYISLLKDGLSVGEIEPILIAAAHSPAYLRLELSRRPPWHD